jgi:hypothetical protein
MNVSFPRFEELGKRDSRFYGRCVILFKRGRGELGTKGGRPPGHPLQHRESQPFTPERERRGIAVIAAVVLPFVPSVVIALALIILVLIAH